VVAARCATMNPTLPAAEADALLEILGRRLVQIRLVAGAGDSPRAEALADALHNVPALLREGHRWGWTVADFRHLFLDPLIERYSEFEGLRQALALAR
jgi:hypothetical protein